MRFVLKIHRFQGGMPDHNASEIFAVSKISIPPMGQKINETALRFGDRVRFGKIEALFESDVSDQAQPLPELREVAARPAESSARPADFANASPFQNRKRDRDPMRQAVLAAAAIALLAFVASMIAVLMMQAPL